MSKVNNSSFCSNGNITNVYSVGTLVMYENAVYRCIIGNTGVNPTNNSYGTLVNIEDLLSLKTNNSYSGNDALNTVAQTLSGGINELVNNKLSVDGFNTAIANYYNKTETDALLVQKPNWQAYRGQNHSVDNKLNLNDITGNASFGGDYNSYTYVENAPIQGSSAMAGVCLYSVYTLQLCWLYNKSSEFYMRVLYDRTGCDGKKFVSS